MPSTGGDALKKTSVTTSSFVSPPFPLSESRQGFNLAAGLDSGDSQQREEHSHGIATTGTRGKVAGLQQQVECMHDALACDNNEQASARQVIEEFEPSTFAEHHGASTSTAREVSSGFDMIGNEVERSASDFSDADRSSFDTSARDGAVQGASFSLTRGVENHDEALIPYQSISLGICEERQSGPGRSSSCRKNSELPEPPTCQAKPCLAIAADIELPHCKSKRILKTLWMNWNWLVTSIALGRGASLRSPQSGRTYVIICGSGGCVRAASV
ncbi:hypothetical protein V6N12_034894 [Hibiscus sabdariffa]|uniref:Uncharacterized protein n=1 Tax=Hibiscus sabdariffa TaxID=183260 RepID=A0ABR2BNR9_9ROSI